MSSSEDLFKEIIAEGLPLLEEFCRIRKEEDLHLDFKEKSRPSERDLNDYDKENLAKAFSGFANSDGGVVIWGIKASKVKEIDAAEELRPISSISIFNNKVHSLLKELVSPAVDAVQIDIIENSTSDEGFLIMHIPQSDEVPHMAKAKNLHRNYIRQEDSFKKAEHYQIADMFGRRAQPILRVYGILQNVSSSNYPDRTRYPFDVDIVLKNFGKGTAKLACVCIKKPINYDLEDLGTSNDSGGEFTRVRSSSPWVRKYLANGNLAIYPEDEIVFAKLHFGDLGKWEMPKDLIIPYGLFSDGMKSVFGELVIGVDEIQKYL